MLCEVGKVDDRLTGVVPYPTFLTISGFQAATLAALSASNGWAAETVLDIVGAASSCHLITPCTVYLYSHSARDSAKHQVRPVNPSFIR